MSLNEVAVELSHSVKIFGGFARRKGKNAYPGKTFSRTAFTGFR